MNKKIIALCLAVFVLGLVVGGLLIGRNRTAVPQETAPIQSAETDTPAETQPIQSVYDGKQQDGTMEVSTEETAVKVTEEITEETTVETTEKATEVVTENREANEGPIDVD